MKKLILMAAVAIVAFGSCQKTTGPSANLKTEIDTVSYELGMANSRGLKPYLAERMGIDTAYMDEFYKGLVYCQFFISLSSFLGVVICSI